MLYPKNLEKGYKIGVTATSDGLAKETDINRLENGIKHFQNLGYPVVETKNVRTSIKGRSSDGRTRAVEFMDLVNDPEIRVILAASGGDYLVEMLTYIDFETIKRNPTWVQGYSDITGLTFTITTNLDIATIYASNFSSFGMEPWHSSLEDCIKILEGKDFLQHSYEKYQDGFVDKITGLEPYVLEKDVVWKNQYPKDWPLENEICVQGRTLGGCLDVLLNLVGTRFDQTKEFIQKYKNDGILWFLETYDLSSEDIIRGLWQLKEAGWFQYAKGFIFGRPAMFRSYTDTSYEEAVCSVLGEFNLPIIFDVDIGHKPPQLTMINGAIATITSRDGKGNILFERR